MSETATKKGVIYVRTSKKVGEQTVYSWEQINIESSMSNIEGLVEEFAKFVESSNLFDGNGKIEKSHIPTEIIAGVTYGGTTNGNQLYLSNAAKYILDKTEDNTPLYQSDGVNHQGLFYIVTASFTLGGIDYKTGDWLVSTSTGWQKIDNTDEITSVNNRKGSIYIYMGAYSSTTSYYRGDIISKDGDLYIATCGEEEELKGADPATDSRWKVFGKDYTDNISQLSSSLSATTTEISLLPKFTCSTNAPTPSDSDVPGSIWIQTE